MIRETRVESSTAWKGLYRVGGAAAILAAALFRRHWGAEVWLLKAMGLVQLDLDAAPVRAVDWFALLESRPFLGMVMFDVMDLVNYALVGLLLLALYAALKRTAPGAMLVATASGLLSIGVFFASNQSFAMLNLSRHYAAASGEAERTMFLAAGEALLGIDNPGLIYHGTGIQVSFFLIFVTGLIISVVMLRSKVFGRWASIAGLLANGIGICTFPIMAFAPALTAFPPALSAPFRLLWYILIGLRLFKLARGDNAQN